MARSQFNFVVAIPDGTTGALEVAGGSTVQVAIKYRDTSYSAATVYSDEIEGTGSIAALNPNATTGKVSGWLEDGRYRAVISSTTSAFTTITHDFDVRSGGEFNISTNGVPSSPSNPQIAFDDNSSGNPAIKIGSGSAAPDIVIQRTGSNQLTFDALTSGSLSTVFIGDVKLAGASDTLDVNNSRIQNTATPQQPSDAANKGYVDANNVSVEERSYNGRIHNMPLLSATAAIAAPSAGVMSLSRIAVPLNTSMSAISFVRGSGSGPTTFQFGVFAEYNDFDSTRKLLCLSSSEVTTASWATNATQELSLGVYKETLTNGSHSSPTTLTVDSTADFLDSGNIRVNGTLAAYTSKTDTTFVGVTGLSGSISDNTKVTQFIAEPFYYGDWTLEANLTGNLYAGVVSTGSLQTLGTSVTSPILSTDLGLADVDQFPYFAGTSTPSPSITISQGVTYYKGPDTSFRVLGSVEDTESLPSSGNNIDDAYIIDQALHIYNGSSWVESTVLPFLSARATAIPFVRVRV
jgi:hypothetical protein